MKISEAGKKRAKREKREHPPRGVSRRTNCHSYPAELKLRAVKLHVEEGFDLGLVAHDIQVDIKSARAPTRSPQGHRARQNAAKNHAGSVVNPADLHAEGNARGGGERAPASEFHPEPSRGRRRRDGGGGHPPSEARGIHSGAAAPRVEGCWKAAAAGGLRKAGRKGGSGAGGKHGGGMGGRAAKGGKARPRKGGLMDVRLYDRQLGIE